MASPRKRLPRSSCRRPSIAAFRQGSTASASRARRSGSWRVNSGNSRILPPAPVALMGLGNMGLPMGRRLAEAGYRITGYDTQPAARDRFRGQGCAVADDLVAAVGDAAAVITMLPDGKIVRTVVEAMRP